MIKIRLSGGPDGKKFSGFSNKKEVERYIRKMFEFHPFEFVQGAKHADYIVFPNEVNFASKSASLTNGKQLTLDAFIDEIDRIDAKKSKKYYVNKKKKSSGKKKSVKKSVKKATKKTSTKRKSTKKSVKKSTKRKSIKKSLKKPKKGLKTNRPSPSVSATEHHYQTRIGNDGNFWKSKPNKNNVFSWRKV